MSIDYDVTLGVGVAVTRAELERVFCVRREAETHEEPRFDPRTGAPAAPEVVVDRGAWRAFRISDGEVAQDFEDEWEFLDALAGRIGCGWDYWVGYDGDAGRYLFKAALELDDSGVEDGRFSCSGGAGWAEVCALGPELERIDLALRSYGLRPSGAVVAPVWSIS